MQGSFEEIFEQAENNGLKFYGLKAEIKLDHNNIQGLLSLKTKIREKPLLIMPHKSYNRFLKGELFFCTNDFIPLRVDPFLLAGSFFDTIEEECKKFIKAAARKSKFLLLFDSGEEAKKTDLITHMYNFHGQKKKLLFIKSVLQSSLEGEDLVKKINCDSVLHEACNCIAITKIKLTKDFFNYRFLEILLVCLNSDVHLFYLSEEEE